MIKVLYNRGDLVIPLPQAYLHKMKSFMKTEYDAFLKSYDEIKHQGLRLNTLKIDIEDFLKHSPFQLESIPWVQEGFYYAEEDRPGRHPYHESGLYYIQEPSAMVVGVLLNPHPGERILDLCAAPGGKSTHIGARLQGKGLLVSNEIHPSRAKILSQNIERMGITNCVVTNESPQNLSKKFQNYFHKILVDAPCSGEGMFRKDPETCSEWSLENVSRCAERQLEILQSAAKMLMPNGILVYSTCTFSPEENEGVIAQFLERHRAFSVEAVERFEGFERGKPEWIDSQNQSLIHTIRLWPHKIRGEGHYIALLKKNDGEPSKIKNPTKKLDEKLLKDYFDFGKEYLMDIPKGRFVFFKDQLYKVPEEMLSLEQLKVLRAGLHLGTMKKNRFEPSHALALSLKHVDVKNNIFMDSNSDEIVAYLKGETINKEGKKGWNLVNVDGYSIGWCKIANNMLKNHYPKGLRWVGR